MYTAGYKGTIVSVPKGQEKVFFSEGGKFDQDFKCFYFTDDDTPETFDHWLPENTVAIISEGFYIYEAPVICNRCNKRTSVISLASQSLHIKKEQNKKGERWDEGDCLYSFDHIRFIPFPQRDLSRKHFLNGIICCPRKDQLNIGVINANIAELCKMKIFWLALYLVHLITNALK